MCWSRQILKLTFGSQAGEVKARLERDHKAAKHSLKQQLQRLQTDLSSQAASALQSKSALRSCQADCSQLEETIATFKSDEQQWRNQVAAVQAHRDQMGRQHWVWGRRLAELLHWRRSGFSELRRVMQAWAVLVSSPDHRMLQHGSGVVVADTCHLKRTQACAERVNVNDGWRHHDRRLLGCCFRGDCPRAIKLHVCCVDDLADLLLLLLRGLSNNGLSPLLAFSYQQQSAFPERRTATHKTLAVAVADPCSAHVAGWLCALRHTYASPLVTTAQPGLQVSRHFLLSPSIPFALSASHSDQQCDKPQLDALPAHRRTRSLSPSLSSLDCGYAAQPAAWWRSDAHESHRSIAPVRPATALASRTIKYRASSLVAAPALHSFATEAVGCRLCDLQGMQGVSGDPLHRTGQGCCKDCGYLSNSTEQDPAFTLSLYRPPAAAAASSGGCQHLQQTEDVSSAAALGLRPVPVVPSSFLDHLASRKPSHCVSGSHDQMPDAVLSGVQQTHSIAAHDSASGNQKLLSSVLDAASADDSKAAFGHCLQTSPVFKQPHAKILHQQQQAEQQQQLGSDVRRRSSPAVADDSWQLALSSADCQAKAVSSEAAQLATADTLQVQQQGIAAAVEQHVQPTQQQEQQPGLTKGGSSCSAARHTTARDWQLPQSISDQLQQARLSVTAIPRLTSSQPTREHTCEQTQPRLVNTCDEATQIVTCMSMPSQDHSILAQRLGMEHDEADWVPNEADASGSSSEGSVSSESNLRPSSVGRCRVNAGRHSKVVLRSI